MREKSGCFSDSQRGISSPSSVQSSWYEMTDPASPTLMLTTVLTFCRGKMLASKFQGENFSEYFQKVYTQKLNTPNKYVFDRNLCGYKFLRIFAKFAKVSTRKTFQFWWFTKINIRKNFCRKAFLDLKTK